MKNTKRFTCFVLSVLLVFMAALPVFAAGDTTTIGASDPSGAIRTIKDLDGKRIGVQTGVLYEDLIKDEISDEEWLYYKMPNDMIPALQSGRIDAYLIEEVGYYAQRYAHPELRVMEEKAGYCDFAVIVGNNAKQPVLFAQMQEFIKKGKESGWLDQLYDYWVKNWDPNTCHIENIPETTGENGSVIIAIEGGYEPFSFESNGQFSGYDVEFMMNFCAEYGYKWDFQAMEFDSIAVGAIAGKYDFGMNIVVDEERAENSVLTDPYYRCDIVFVLPEEKGSSSSGEIATIKDLDGKRIGVQTGVLYEDLIKDTIEGETWLYYKMPNDMIPALQSGRIDAYLIEEVGYYAQRYAHPELRVMDEKAGYCDFAVIVGNNEKQEVLFDQMQEFIRNRKADGWLDDLYDYWVKNWDPNTCYIETVPETSGENGSVVIAIEGGYEPFSFESNGEFSGYDVEFMMNFCAEYGYKWDFQAMEFDSIAVGAIAGKYDFGMNIVVDEERAENSVLSDPYYRCDIVFVLSDKTETEGGFFARIAKNFNDTFIKDARWRLFLEGIGTTMLITVLSIIIGTVLGFGIYMACRHGNKIANGITNVFNWFIEGVPTVVFLMLLAFVVFSKSNMNVTWVSIIGFSLIFACQMYDMLCVGCNAIPRGQTEASRALGYSDRQCFFKIILPQAARHFMPIYKNDVVSLIKETAIVGYIAVRDLTKAADLVRSRTYTVFFALITVTIIYFLLEGILTGIVKRVQLKVEPEHRTKEEILKGIVESE
ncbi:MAG: transporter substrate-binding domain-containing protein [Firmicutes bacterium]|nr:transporter substrate-binding domain-containing protein [Bacillota bacterium]